MSSELTENTYSKIGGSMVYSSLIKICWCPAQDPQRSAVAFTGTTTTTPSGNVRSAAKEAGSGNGRSAAKEAGSGDSKSSAKEVGSSLPWCPARDPLGSAVAFTGMSTTTGSSNGRSAANDTGSGDSRSAAKEAGSGNSESVQTPAAEIYPAKCQRLPEAAWSSLVRSGERKAPAVAGMKIYVPGLGVVAELPADVKCDKGDRIRACSYL